MNESERSPGRPDETDQLARPEDSTGNVLTATDSVGPAGMADAAASEAAPTPQTPEARATALRLARLHLRTGSLGLARAELEALAGGGPLEPDGLVDLAEARWRTGDLSGAGEAATIALANGVDSPTAIVIAVEAVAALGRPGEARRLAARAIEHAGLPVDAIFAGMPRSPIWPADPSASVEALGRAPGAVRGDVLTPGTRGKADETRTDESEGLPDPHMELEAARDAIVSGDETGGAIRLAVILRIAPALAPAVLDATGGRRGAALDLVRGDAYRLVGHETEARQAYSAAARAAAEPPASTVSRHPSAGATTLHAAGSSVTDTPDPEEGS
jgi:hypothetical protein